jgi:hypothetical protein
MKTFISIKKCGITKSPWLSKEYRTENCTILTWSIAGYNFISLKSGLSSQTLEITKAVITWSHFSLGSLCKLKEIWMNDTSAEKLDLNTLQF